VASRFSMDDIPGISINFAFIVSQGLLRLVSQKKQQMLLGKAIVGF
jgi:hypothetical protein